MVISKINKEWLNSLNGTEVWTNAFGQRTCVGIKKDGVIKEGKKIVLTSKQMNRLRKDHLIQEYGTTDIKKIMKMEGF